MTQTAIEGLTDALADLKYRNAYPSAIAYSRASPSDQRAILRRWRQLEAEQVKYKEAGGGGLFTRYPKNHDEAMESAARHLRPIRRQNHYDDPATGITGGSPNENGCRSFGDQVGE